MEINRLDNPFNNFVVNNELIINEDYWTKITNSLSQEYIIQCISDTIHDCQVNLPYRKYEFNDMINDYLALKNLDTTKLIIDGAWSNKFEYKYHFLDKYVGLSNVGNIGSDYFHQVERWKCDATGYPSPQKTWETERFRLTLLKALFSLKVKEVLRRLCFL